MTESIPITKERKRFRGNTSGKPVSSARCKEKIKGVKGLKLEDVIHSFRNKHVFSPPVELPFDQLKVVIGYGFASFGRGIIASEVASLLVDSGILFNPKSDNTVRKVLHELTREGLVTSVSRTSQAGRQYNIWHFKDKIEEMGLAASH